MTTTDSTQGDRALATRHDDIEVVPLRHWGRWAAAAVVALLAASLMASLARNPNLEWGTVGDYLFRDFVLRGVGVTIMLTVVAMLIGTVGGVVVAVMRLSANPVLRAVASLYVWFFRGTPLLVQIIFWGFLAALYQRIQLGIPFTDLHVIDVSTNAVVGPVVAAILALGLNEIAYAAEVVRGGILAVDRGQDDASLALGLTKSQAMRTITLPQAMRVIVPPMGNETITMLKSTALVAVIGGKDLLTAVQTVYSQNFKVMPLLVVAALWYLALVSVLSVGQYFLERRFGRGHGPGGSQPGLAQRWLAGRKGA
ncbi:amino acid ABC transporter permease [uncultured Nocardioides sp.]|uniref:ABC transporter, permease protein (Cluster 3, basic aa/glutamine/opines) n=1 Tax=uncultured Nocardioides sp. TaxID=198441 RepID=A0A6J4N7E9_9ACTN|nr:amino acid ABC transporter permease [uncultured Nocardioides sp.]CAA9376992.1 MAG: ABC transporter, permease protein (cluster 3, basic aa/glutamine/opines) [uncultured Nocardioides sp.]